MKKFIVFFAFILLVGAGCGSSSGQNDSIGTKVGDRAPDFSIATIDGEEISSESLDGRVLVMTSMASWCPTCMVEAKQLRLAREQVDEDVVFLSISIDPTDDADKLNTFKSEQQTPWHFAGLFSSPNVRQMVIDYKMTQRETTYVIDGDGVIVYRDSGISIKDKILEAIELAS